MVRVQNSPDRGEVPVGELFSGICLLAAGLLLLTPGFLTDSVGFALLYPEFGISLQAASCGRWSRRGAFHMDGEFSTGQTRRQSLDNGHRW